MFDLKMRFVLKLKYAKYDDAWLVDTWSKKEFYYETCNETNIFSKRFHIFLPTKTLDIYLK